MTVISATVLRSITSLLRDLCLSMSSFRTMLMEHVQDNGQLLPHVLFADLVSWLSALDPSSSATVAVVRAVTLALEIQLANVVRRSDDDEWKDYLLTLLVTSFFENFDRDEIMFRIVRGEFGPLLEGEYREYLRHLAALPIGWRP